jgi:hypothetical protein
MNQPTVSRVLYNDDSLRLLEEEGIYILEYLDSDGKPARRQTYKCRVCALRSVLLATVEIQGYCNCSPWVLRLEDDYAVEQACGGPN